MSSAGAVLGGVGGGLQVVGGFQTLAAAREARRASEERALATTEAIDAFQTESVEREAALERNALLIDIQSSRVIQEAEDRAEDTRLISRQIRGTISASAAASGVDVGSGSVLEALSEAAFNTELQAQEVIRQGEAAASELALRARGAREEALGLRRQRPFQIKAILRSGEAEVGVLNRQANLLRLQGFQQINQGILTAIGAQGGGNQSGQQNAQFFGSLFGG